MKILGFCKKPYQKSQTAVKTLKKIIKMLQQEHTNSVKYYYMDF